MFITFFYPHLVSSPPIGVSNSAILDDRFAHAEGSGRVELEVSFAPAQAIIIDGTFTPGE